MIHVTALANVDLTDTTSDWATADCDGDGVTNLDEVGDGTDLNNPCEFNYESRTVEPTDEWNAIDCDTDGVLNGNEDNLDTDNDNTPDYLDRDDDDDGINTIDEDADGNGDPTNDDCDEDNLPDYLDPDTCNIEIPTLFTPNGDGVNDEFEITGLANSFPDFEMKIYNRWGNIVFDYKNNGRSIPQWWDGFSNGRMTIKSTNMAPTGTYFYVINFNDDNRKPESGWVYLNR